MRALCRPMYVFVWTFFAISGIAVGAPLNASVVRNWSRQVENYLLTIAEEGLQTQQLQRLYDGANYTVEQKDGFDTINSVKSRLGNYFVKKENAARVC